MSHPAQPSSGLAWWLLPHPEPLAQPGHGILPRPPPPPAERRAGQCAPQPSLGTDGVIFFLSLPARDRQSQGSDRPVRCPDQGPRIAWALPSQGGGRTGGQGGGRPRCPGEGESDPPRQAHSGPEADAFSLVGTGDTPPPPLWSDSRVTAPAPSWRSVENSRQLRAGVGEGRDKQWGGKAGADGTH